MRSQTPFNRKREVPVKDGVRRTLDRYKPSIWWYMIVPSQFNPLRGLPDFIGCWCGRFFYVETKRQDKKPRRLQQIVHATLNAAGARGWPSVDDAGKFQVEFDAWAETALAESPSVKFLP